MKTETKQLRNPIQIYARELPKSILFLPSLTSDWNNFCSFIQDSCPESAKNGQNDEKSCCNGNIFHSSFKL
jgi:hypothetical protein